MSGKTFFVKHN